ncbi:MAG: hypothetical protein GEU90_17195 [Gemmatimonas sp.]|nr:hypothetical protein [Gemmatimonas sp.]
MKRLIVLTVLVKLLPSMAWSQAMQESASQPQGGGAAEEAGVEGYAEAVSVSESPRLDGRLDDPVWKQAPRIAGFVQREPIEGIEAADDTELRFIYTDDALYVGARMYGDPGQVRADLTRRDVEGDAERLVISLDTFLDRRTAYSFVVTAYGWRALALGRRSLGGIPGV